MSIEASVHRSLPAESSAQLRRVAVTGSGGAIGRRVVRLLASTPGVEEVIAIDETSTSSPYGPVRYELLDLLGSPRRLEAAFRGVDVIVHLAYSTEHGDQPLLRRVLGAAEAVGVNRVVTVSSAMVYGAWSSNPVPLSEDAPLRPNPECDFAVRKADAERILWEWADESVERVVVALRPAPAVSATDASMIGQAVLAAAPIRTGTDDPPVQFVHMDDLATAAVHAASLPTSGAYNVNADGWLNGDELRALLGARIRLRLPIPLPERLDRLVARRTRKPVPAGLIEYTRHPWAIANDRLRATGWRPRYGNDQTFVAADDGAPWDSLNARQRQYWSLGVGGALIGGLVGLAIWLIRRHRRRISRAGRQ
ncbi:MAG: nucleoside-diphosphate-sugar epimerase [Candidatus Poriferisodalaceae bacterium]|jgi:nucleoside-diphosphate-sugar epimerase